MVSLVSRITFIDDRISSSTSSFLIVIEFRFVIFVLDEIPNNHLFHSFFHFRRQFLFVRVKRKNERTRFGRVREKKEDSGGRGEGRELVNNVNEKSVDERAMEVEEEEDLLARNENPRRYSGNEKERIFTREFEWMVRQADGVFDCSSIEKRRRNACQVGWSLPYAQPNCWPRKLRVIAFMDPRDRT